MSYGSDSTRTSGLSDECDNGERVAARKARAKGKFRQRRQQRRKRLRHKKEKIAGASRARGLLYANAATLGIHSTLVPRMLYMFAQLYQNRAQLADRLNQSQKDTIVAVFKQARFASLLAFP